jgi:hypothetical protein
MKMKTGTLLFLLNIALFVMTATVLGQEGRLQISHLDKLAAKAEESVDVNLDGALLQIASKFLSDKKQDEAAVKSLLAGIKGIYVRSFEFNAEGEYTKEDILAIRSQIQSPAWTRMVGVKSKKDREDVEIFMKTEAGGKIGGLAIICAEPKELTVVNIVGSLDLEKLSSLEGQFGIPEMGLESKSKTGKE